MTVENQMKLVGKEPDRNQMSGIRYSQINKTCEQKNEGGRL